jgi:hypothetical protein
MEELLRKEHDKFVSVMTEAVSKQVRNILFRKR